MKTIDHYRWRNITFNALLYPKFTPRYSPLTPLDIDNADKGFQSQRVGSEIERPVIGEVGRRGRHE